MEPYYHSPNRNQSHLMRPPQVNMSDMVVIFGPQQVKMTPSFRMLLIKHYNSFSAIHSRVNPHLRANADVALRNCAKSCHSEWLALGGCFKDPAGKLLHVERSLEFLYSCICHTNWVNFNLSGVYDSGNQYYHQAASSSPVRVAYNCGNPYYHGASQYPHPHPRPPSHQWKNSYGDAHQATPSPGVVVTPTQTSVPATQQQQSEDYESDLTSAVATAMAANPVRRRAPSPHIMELDSTKTLRVVSVPSKVASRFLTIKEPSCSSSTTSEMEVETNILESNSDKINKKVVRTASKWMSYKETALEKNDIELMWLLEASKYLVKEGKSRLDYIKQNVSLTFWKDIDINQYSSVNELVRDQILTSHSKKYDFVEYRRNAKNMMKQIIEEEKILLDSQYGAKRKRQKILSSLSTKWNYYEKNQAMNKILRRDEIVYLSRTVKSPTTGSSAIICYGGKFMGNKAVDDDLEYCHVLMEDTDSSSMPIEGHSYIVEKVNLECILTASEIHKMIDRELNELEGELKALEQNQDETSRGDEDTQQEQMDTPQG